MVQLIVSLIFLPLRLILDCALGCFVAIFGLLLLGLVSVMILNIAGVI